MYNDVDMILPEGFDPNLEEQNFGDPAEETTQTTALPNEPEVTGNEGNGGTEQQPEQLDPPTDPAQVPETPPAPTLKVQFNHEEKELTLEEATPYVRKGLNYDKIERRAKEYESRISRYEDMAKMFGFESADAMMTQAEQNYVDSKVQDLINAGNTEAMARFLVKQEMSAVKSAAPAPAAPEKSVGLSPERKAELDEFSAAFPNVTKIPDAVFALRNKNGYSLATAMRIYEGEQVLEKTKQEKAAALNELAVLKQNQAAAAKAPVTGTVGKAAPEKEEPRDPFLEGLRHGFK